MVCFCQSLHKGGHILGLKEDVSFAKDRVCRACVEGKMHDSPHPSKTIISSKRILELLHVDLFGAVPEASLGGKKYCFDYALTKFKEQDGRFNGWKFNVTK